MIPRREVDKEILSLKQVCLGKAYETEYLNLSSRSDPLEQSSLYEFVLDVE